MENNSSLPFSGKNSASQVKNLVSAAFLLAMIILMSVTPLGFIRLGVTALTIVHVPVILGSVLLGPKYGAILGFSFGMASFLNATFAPDATSFAFSPFYSVGEFQGNAWSLVIAFVPRILTGIVPFFVFVGINRIIRMKYTELVGYILMLGILLGVAVYKLVELTRGGTTALLFDFLIYLSIFIYITADAYGKKFKFRKKETLPYVVSGVLGSLTNTVLVLGFMHLFFAVDLSKIVGTSTDILYKFLFTLIITNGIPEAILASILTVLVCKAVIKQQSKAKIV